MSKVRTVLDGPHATVYWLAGTTCDGNGGAKVCNACYCAAGNAFRAERFASNTREDDKLGVLAIENFFGVNIADLHDLGVVVRILDMLKAALARACRLPDELWDVGDQIDACTRAARDGDRAALGTGWAAFTARIWAPIAIGSKQKLPVSRDGLAATLVDFFASIIACGTLHVT